MTCIIRGILLVCHAMQTGIFDTREQYEFIVLTPSSGIKIHVVSSFVPIRVSPKSKFFETQSSTPLKKYMLKLALMYLRLPWKNDCKRTISQYLNIVWFSLTYGLAFCSPLAKVRCLYTIIVAFGPGMKWLFRKLQWNHTDIILGPYRMHWDWELCNRKFLLTKRLSRVDILWARVRSLTKLDCCASIFTRFLT